MIFTGRSLPHADGHENVMLGVRNVTNTSAILEWETPKDRPILKFKVSLDSYSIDNQSQCYN